MRIDLDYNINNMETRIDNKCKAFTSVEQSRKLAEFLPIESADMWYSIVDNEAFICLEHHNEYKQIPCWSLAALLGIIRKTIGYTIYGVNNVYISCELADFKKIETEVYDNELDACVEMIEKLSKLKML